jgi:hypothetical protein
MNDTAAKWLVRCWKGVVVKPCAREDGWVCEEHPDRPWRHDRWDVPNRLCRNPECVTARVLRAELDAWRAGARQKIRLSLERFLSMHSLIRRYRAEQNV